VEEPLVSIIIVNYNGLKHLKECFDSLFRLKYKNKEIIFVDNGSTDKSIEFIKKNYDNVRIIQLDKNLGFAEPNNIGLAHSKGKYIALLNNDTIVDENWLTELVKMAESSDDIGVVASKIFYYDHKNEINFAGGFMTKHGILNHLSSKIIDHDLVNKPRETFYALGAAELIRRELCLKVGLFDPHYFAYFEDIDISWLAWITGYRVVFAPKAFIYHKTTQVFKKKYDMIFYLHERNKIRTLLKNFQSYKILIPVIIGAIKIRLLEFYSHLIKFDYFATIFIRNYYKAIFWNIIHIRSLFQLRNRINLYRKRSDIEILELIDRFTSYYTCVRKQLKALPQI